MGVFSEMDIDRSTSEVSDDVADTDTPDLRARAEEIDDARQEAEAAAARATLAELTRESEEDEAETEESVAPTAPAATDDEAERRRAHEEAEAARRAEWEARRQKREEEELFAWENAVAMEDDELVASAVAEIGEESERLTRRNIRICVAEILQTYCRGDANFARQVKHNDEGICPRCKKAVTFKSRGMRSHIYDRVTVQIVQRMSDREIVIRIIKAYCNYFEQGLPEFSMHENARTYFRLDEENKLKIEHFYLSYGFTEITSWRKGERPVYFRWNYPFAAERFGYIYQRSLEEELRGTPWQYCSLLPYYRSHYEIMNVENYLRTYIHHPMIEYLVKLGMYHLTTYAVYGETSGGLYSKRFGLNKDGNTVNEILRVPNRYIPFLRQVNPTNGQLQLIQAVIEAGHEPDTDFISWCEDNHVSDPDRLVIVLRYMTPHKMVKYVTEQYEGRGHENEQPRRLYSISNTISDYKDYLVISDELGFDMKKSSVLHPKDLVRAHDRVVRLRKYKRAKVYDETIAQMFAEWQTRYGFKQEGYLVLPPKSSQDIIREGEKLSHCVGGYVESVCKKECVILFIRSVSAPKTPLCTVEVKNGEVKQARCYKNGDPAPEVQNFIELWKKQVLANPVRTAA